MTARTSRILAAAGGAAALSLVLSGCSISVAPPWAGHHHNWEGENRAATGYSQRDLMFAQMMIPHHQQAVDMGTLAETRALDREVKALAAQIKAEQAPEIIQMEGWLTEAGQSGGNLPDLRGHGFGMGMLSEAEMAALENASGAAFDRLYLEGMMKHHEGAIRMTRMIFNSANAEVRALGEAIVQSQTEQIARMEELLER